MILGIDFGVEWNLVINLRARLWKSGEQEEWYSFTSSKEESTTAIMAECAGLSRSGSNQSNSRAASP